MALTGITPNPAGSNATFRYFVPSDINSAQLHIYNLQGTEVKSYKLSARGQSDFTIQSAELSKGVYLALITGDGQISNAMRMVIAR